MTRFRAVDMEPITAHMIYIYIYTYIHTYIHIYICRNEPEAPVQIPSLNTRKAAEADGLASRLSACALRQRLHRWGAGLRYRR